MKRDTSNDNPLMSDEELEFAALFADEQSKSVIRHVDKGELVSGQIIKFGRDVAFVDLGGKAEGIIDLAELSELDLSPGDTVEAMVLSTRGGIRLSRTLASDARGEQLLEEAYETGLPVEGRIVERNKGGFDVTIGGKRAFLPVSHLDLGSVEDLDAWLGRTSRFKIIEYAEGGKQIVVSRRSLMQEEREAAAEQTWATLQVGMVLSGTVRSIQEYGCFVDVGGIDGLVHVKEMQWGRIAHPSDLVSVGQEVTVTVASIDHERQRVGLSMRDAGDDPWKRIAKDIEVGSQLSGQITRLEKYGAFVEVLPGLEGLIHVSELTFARRVHHPRDVLTVGDQVTVTVLDIDASNQRMSLSMKQLEGDPWADAAEQYPLGAAVQGSVERCTTFGVFVSVAPGVTALLPRSESGQPDGVDLGRHFRPGDTIQATVISVDVVERRMALSLGAAENEAEKNNLRDYQKKQSVGATGMGTFADLLQDVKVDE
jgi:small subunit ribosomal protein S1